MSNGNQRVFIAFAGLTLLGASPGNESQPKQDGDAGSQIEPSAPRVSIVEPQSAANHEQACKQGYDNRSSDLCAQWRAADASASAADAAWLFGAIGSVIGLLTLGAAAAAAKFARDAARHTESGAVQAEKAAKAAEDTLEHSREISRTDLRAWVTIDLDLLNCIGTTDFISLVVNVRAKNIGRTPAVRVAVSISATVQQAVVIDSGDLPEIKERPGQMSPIMPGFEIEQAFVERIDKETIETEAARFERGSFEPMIVVDAIVYYHTIIDAEDAPQRLTSIRYHILNSIPSSREYREARMAWLDNLGPAGNGPVRFLRSKSAPMHVT